MMHKLLNAFFLWLVIGAGLSAEMYDPYTLGTYCFYYGEGQYCYLASDGVREIFYFNLAKSGEEINKIIETARKAHKKVSFNKKTLRTESLPVRIAHRYYFQNNYYLCSSCSSPSKVLSISDEDIQYDKVEVFKENIHIANLLIAFPMKLVIMGEAHHYFLTPAQKSRFDILFEQGHTSFDVNLSALQLFSPYRDLLPVEEVIVPLTKVN